MHGDLPHFAAEGRVGVRVEGDARRPVVGGRDLVGRGADGPEPPLGVPPQLLGGEPAHALDEAALDLTAVDRRIERCADVVEDIDRAEPVFTRQRVDGDLAHEIDAREIPADWPTGTWMVPALAPGAVEAAALVPARRAARSAARS